MLEKCNSDYEIRSGSSSKMGYRYSKQGGKKARNDVEEPLDSRPRKKIVPRFNQRPSPSSIPNPDSKGLDLQAMIEERRLLKLAEIRRKKALNQNVSKLN
jgi:hypothetical protein